jgi:quinolinate synthase
MVNAKLKGLEKELFESEGSLARLRSLKVEKRAVIPAHYYQREEIKMVADFIGDSLELSKKCKEIDADVILFAGVKFMAETAKILNPTKQVLIPSLEAGCSLADSITAQDVRGLRNQYPKAAVVSYINTNADVKAESDIICTSANYLKIVESLPEEQVILIPDEYLAKNAAAQTSKEIIDWKGRCVVHERFTPEEIERYKQYNPEIEVLAHIETSPDVVRGSHFAGSTSGMRKYVSNSQATEFMVLTECGMIPTLQKEFPDRQFYTPCSVCPYMKKNTFGGLIRSLETGQYEITVPESVRVKAHKALERMLEY